jgi:hypothetical protein
MVMTEYLSFYYHWVDIADGGLLVSECIIHTAVSVLTLTCFIRCIYYWNLQILNIKYSYY